MVYLSTLQLPCDFSVLSWCYVIVLSYMWMCYQTASIYRWRIMNTMIPVCVLKWKRIRLV